jgi:calcyclin binding protein
VDAHSARVTRLRTAQDEEDDIMADEAWKERLLDAEEIEQAAAKLERPTARLQLETLAKRLRKESAALERVAKSQDAAAATTATEDDTPAVEEIATTSARAIEKAAPPAPVPRAVSTTSSSAAPIHSPSVKFVSIDRFSFDAGQSKDPFVTLYVDLPRVGSIPRENIETQFTKQSFDLVVKDLEGKNYRLYKDGLEKDIDADKCKIIVKADKILVKLAKRKTDYGGFDYWTKLTDTKKSKKEADTSKDPQQSIMQLMKQMYDEGDDSMKKMIGETMLKQRNGELGKDPVGGGDMDF